MRMMYFEDFEPGQVYDLGCRTLTLEEMVAFASEYDPQPFHTDPEAAKASIFGGLIASGSHTMALYMRLLVDSLLSRAAAQGSPGVNTLRYLKPVYPGDALRARFTVMETMAHRRCPQLGVVMAKGEVLNQKGDVVLWLMSASFFTRKPRAP